MTDLEEVRKIWLQERATFESFAKELENRLRADLLREGIWAETSSRAKEVDSLVRKLIKKPEHDYETVGDKAGLRVVLRYKNELQAVLDIAERLFDCRDLERKSDGLKLDQVGYLSVHVDVRLREDDPLVEQYPPASFRSELQVRTMAQHLWSEMSHDTFYKNDESLNPLSLEIKRRVYLLAGVVEVADNEFDRLSQEVPNQPEVELLKVLEKQYYKLTTRRGDSELSLDVLRLLIPLYEDEPPQIAAHLERFCSEQYAVIHDVYEQAEDSPDRSAYLYQPEALLIYDRLRADQTGIRKAWNTRYPEEELERIANEFGISFD